MGNCISSDMAAASNDAVAHCRAVSSVSIMARREELRFANLRPSDGSLAAPQHQPVAPPANTTAVARNPLEQPLHNFGAFRRTHRRRSVTTIQYHHEDEDQEYRAPPIEHPVACRGGGTSFEPAPSPSPFSFSQDNDMIAVEQTPQHEPPETTAVAGVVHVHEEGFNSLHNDGVSNLLLASSLDESSSFVPPPPQRVVGTTGSWDDNIVQPTTATPMRSSFASTPQTPRMMMTGSITQQQQEGGDHSIAAALSTHHLLDSESSARGHPQSPSLHSHGGVGVASGDGSSSITLKQSSAASSLRAASHSSSFRLPPAAYSVSRRTSAASSDPPLFEIIS